MDGLKRSLLLLLAVCAVPFFARAEERGAVHDLSLILQGRDPVRLSDPARHADWFTLLRMDDRIHFYCGYDGERTSVNLAWGTDSHRQWERDTLAADSIRGGLETVRVIPTVWKKTKFPLFLISSGRRLHLMDKPDLRSGWTSRFAKPLFSDPTTRPVSMMRLPGGELAFLQTSLVGGKYVIQRTLSGDLGVTWSTPQMVLQHNQASLYGWSVVNYPKRGKSQKNFMILSDAENRAYISVSTERGAQWSYPEALSENLSGDYFDMEIRYNRVYLLFRRSGACRSTDPRMSDCADGDLLLWVGTLHELEKGAKEGMLYKIADASDLDLSGGEVSVGKGLGGAVTLTGEIKCMEKGKLFIALNYRNAAGESVVLGYVLSRNDRITGN